MLVNCETLNISSPSDMFQMKVFLRIKAYSFSVYYFSNNKKVFNHVNTSPKPWASVDRRKIGCKSWLIGCWSSEIQLVSCNFKNIEGKWLVNYKIWISPLLAAFEFLQKSEWLLSKLLMRQRSKRRLLRRDST